MANAAACGLLAGTTSVAIRPMYPQTQPSRFIVDHTVPWFAAGVIMGGLFKFIPREYLRPNIGTTVIAMCGATLMDAGIEVYRRSV